MRRRFRCFNEGACQKNGLLFCEISEALSDFFYPRSFRVLKSIKIPRAFLHYLGMNCLGKMHANCELTLPMERQIIISGIGLGLRFFYLMNFFTQSDPPQPAMRAKSPPGTRRQLGGGDLTLIAGWG